MTERFFDQPDPNSESQKQNIPIVTRYKRGRIMWNPSVNTPEQNEQIGLRNIQAMFLEKFPEFNELFPRGEDGKITEYKREEAKEFILERVGSRSKFTETFRGSPTVKSTAPYFESSRRVVIEKSFTPWGIEFQKQKRAPDGWMTNRGLANNLDKDQSTIKRLVDKYKNEHPEWIKTYLDSQGKPRDHYAPDLVIRIADELGVRHSAPQGWMTRGALSELSRISNVKIEHLVSKYITYHPEWVGMYLDSIGNFHVHYAPEVVTLVLNELDQESFSPKDWKTTGALTMELKVSFKRIKNLAEKFRIEHPEWFAMFLDPIGKLCEHYAPELIEEIKRIIKERKKSRENSIIPPEEARRELWKYLEIEE